MNIPDNNWGRGLAVFARLSAWIAFPVIIGAMVGKWLDNRYQSEPWLFLGSVGFAFLISMYGLITSTIKEYAEIAKEAEDKKKKENKQDNKTEDKD